LGGRLTPKNGESALKKQALLQKDQQSQANTARDRNQIQKKSAKASTFSNKGKKKEEITAAANKNAG